MYASSLRTVLLSLLGTALVLAAGRVASGQAAVHYGCQANQILDEYNLDDNLGHMGQAIALGDFNHDGIQDIVFGGYDRLPPPPQNQPADDFITCVYVHLGTGNSPNSGLPVFRHRLTIRGFQTLDLFGFSVVFIGDIGGDPSDDIVVGAPRFDGSGLTDSGRVSVIFGSSDLHPTAEAPAEVLAVSTQAFSFDGTIDGGWFGASLATARDSSGNFLGNLVVGAPGNSITSSTVYGNVYVYGTPTMQSAGTLAGGTLGVPIGAGTLSGTPGITGSVATGYVATANRLHYGLALGDLFGESVAFVGDLNGDGAQEYLVGAPQYAAESGLPTTKGTGYAQLFRLANAPPLLTIWGVQGPNDHPRQEGEAFGFAVGGGLDLSIPTDGVPDLLIGAPLFNVGATIGVPGTGALQAGRVRAFSGQQANGGTAFPLLDSGDGDGTVLIGISGSGQFGSSIGVLPDINNDGGSEILVGAWQGTIASSDVCGSSAHLRTDFGGYAILFTSGSLPSSPPGTKLVTFYGEAAKDHLGRAVAAGDLYGTSGLPEIVLSGLAWTPEGWTAPVYPTELGRGYVWNGDTVLVPSP